MHIFSKSFFTDRSYNLDDLDLESAIVFVSSMSQSLPSCIEIITMNPEHCAERIENLRERVSHLSDCDEKKSLLKQISECRKIIEESIGKVSPSTRSRTPLSERESPISDYLAISTAQRLVMAAIDQGKLGQALWIVKKSGIPLDSLKSVLSHKVYEWMELNLIFSSDDPPSLDIMALNLGWGYKASNLVILQKHAIEVTSRCETCLVRVPEFLPISDIEMQYFIHSRYSDLTSDWYRFLDIIRDGSDLSASGLAVLQEIQENILRCFREENYDSPQLSDWLMRYNPELLAIRSSGNEDLGLNSNAGGNDTELLVAPNLESISSALGKVLASYFGDKSIRQRIANNDVTLFTSNPLLSIVIQEMVSDEKACSGVMFTSSIGDDLTELATGLGFCLGIVEGSVPTDRLLVDTRGNISRSVCSKDSRLVAEKTDTGSYICSPARISSRDVRDSPSLSDDCARDMKTVATYFSREVYGDIKGDKPLDMEFSIITHPGCEKPVIHLLQARPLIHIESPNPPSYIDTTTISEGKKISGKTLLSAGSYVRNSEESIILVCETIDQAEQKFNQESRETQEKIKTVIIRKAAPSTCHPAVNLRALGIGVLIVEKKDEFKKIKGWLELGYKVSVDLQQGIAVHQDEALVTVGYICYPIPLEYSIRPSKMILNLAKNPETARKELREFSFKLDGLINTLTSPGISHSLDRRGFRELLDTFAKGSPDEITHAAAALLYSLKKLLKLSLKDASFSKERLVLLMITEEILKLIEHQLLAVVTSEPQSLQRLYPVRLIESCLFQKSHVIGGFSIASILEAIKNQRKILRAVEVSFDDLLKTEEALAKAPLIRAQFALISPYEQKLFNAIIKKLEAIDPEKVERITLFFQTLSKLGVLTEWINRNFTAIRESANIYNPKHIPTDYLVNFVDSIITQASEALPELRKSERALKKINYWKAQILEWEKPKHIEKNMQKMIQDIAEMGFSLDPLNLNSAIKCFQFASDLGKLVILGKLRQVVNVYDEIIKAVKASSKYPNKFHKARHLKGMLDQYRLMMRTILLIPNETGSKIEFVGDIPDSGPIPLDDYLHALDAGGTTMLEGTQNFSPGFDNIDLLTLDPEKLDLEMKSSPFFDVSSILVTGSGNYAYSRAFPVTLEDYFTLYHQNMLTAIGRLQKNLGISLEELPRTLAGYLAILGEDISSVQVHDGKLQLDSEIAVREHSVHIEVTCDLITAHPILTKISFFGADENSRWLFTAAFAAGLGGDIPSLEIEPPKINYSKATGLTLEFIDRGMSSGDVGELARYISEIQRFTKSRHTPLEYIELISAMRRSFGVDPTIPFSLEDLEKGAFSIGPQAVFDLIQSGQLLEAKNLLTRLKLVGVRNPSLLEIRSSGAPFFSYSPNRWGDACLELERRIEGTTSITEEAHLPVFDIFDELKKDLGNPDHFLKVISSLSRQDAFQVVNSLYSSKLMSRSEPPGPIPKSVLYNKKVLKKIFSFSYKPYNFLTDEMQKDPEILIMACQTSFAIFDEELAPHEVICDSRLVSFVRREVLKKNLLEPSSINRHFGDCDEAREVIDIIEDIDISDEEIAKALLKKKGSLITSFSSELQANHEVVSVAVAEDPRVLDIVDAAFLSDPQVAIASASRHPETLLLFSEEIRSDRDIIIQIIKKCPAALQFASSKLQHDRKLVALAWSSKPTEV